MTSDTNWMRVLRRHTFAVTIAFFATMPVFAQNRDRVPEELRGRWKIVRELNTRTISCWGEKDAKKVLGTTIEYLPDALRWRNLRTNAEGSRTMTISADQFHDENSGGGANDSQIDFRQLGINSRTATQITINHSDAQITGATAEFPGDSVLLKNPNTIVFSLCNVYFEAKRVNTNDEKSLKFGLP